MSIYLSYKLENGQIELLVVIHGHDYLQSIGSKLVVNRCKHEVNGIYLTVAIDTTVKTKK